LIVSSASAIRRSSSNTMFQLTGDGAAVLAAFLPSGGTVDPDRPVASLREPIALGLGLVAPR
jgi:hypothetical protein